LRVSEDFGSGLKANVVLESGFSADTGGQTQGTSNLGVSSRLFGRQAFVSLASASLGELRMGRQYTMSDEWLSITNPFGNTTVTNPGSAVSTGGTNPAARSNKLPLFVDPPRVDNSVQYISPTFGGFRVQAMVAAGEGTLAGGSVPPGTIVPRYEALKAQYTNGPLNLGVAYEQNRNGSVAGTHDKISMVGGNYDFGAFKVLGGYQRAKGLTLGGVAYSGVPSFSNVVPANSANAGFPLDEIKAYTVGVAVPFGQTTLGVNYTRVKYENATNTLDATLGKIGVGAVYSLSKQASLYAAAAIATGDLKDSIQEKRVVQFGLRKAF
jgi:predicted porin